MLDIDWSKVPEGYDWVAQDEDGDVFAYSHEPFLFEGEFDVWDGFSGCILLRRDKPNENWKNTLTKRPAK